MVNRLLTLIFAILILSACKDNQSETQKELNNSKTLWSQQKINDYQITTKLSCFCIMTYDIINVVDNGQLTTAFYLNSGATVPADKFQYQKSIQNYFDLIQQAINNEAFSIDVSYDPTYGFPTNIAIDYDQNIADDEVSYQLSNFKVGIEVVDKPELNVELVLKDQFDQSTELFIQGESITLDMSVTNNSSVDAEITFPSSQQFDFYIKDLSGTEVWRWSENKVFNYAFTKVIILAGDTIEFSESWDQVPTNTEVIPTGTYMIYGSLLEQSEAASSELVIQ
jgi:hypothetical protein